MDFCTDMCNCGTDHNCKGLLTEVSGAFVYVISTVVERSLDKLGMTEWGARDDKEE